MGITRRGVVYCAIIVTELEKMPKMPFGVTYFAVLIKVFVHFESP